VSRKIWLTSVFVVLIILAASLPAIAQDKTLYWQRYDVNIFVEKNSDIQVEEVQNIQFTSGTFRFGFAAIPLDRLEQITDVRVSEIINGSERDYSPNSSNAYGFTTHNTGTDLEITWYFPPTANAQHTYILRYRVIGGLRIYEGGDQLWWKAVAPDHNFPIQSSRVTVTPPQVFSQDQLVVEAYGAPATANFTSGGQVVFEAQSIPADEMLEVRVQFPHGIVEGTAPGWQAADDRRTEWGPVVGVVSGALALLLLLGGPVGVYMLWYTRGRDLPTGIVPEYITEPPSDLPAALVGTLVDEKADLKDVIAGILDLAQRGALRMEEQTKDTSSGFGVSKEFVFHLQDAAKAIHPHEKRLIERLFSGGNRTRKLSDLHQKFYTAIPKLKTDLYNETVQQKLFPQNPVKVRGRWMGLAVAGFILSILFSCLPLFALGDFSPLVACPGIMLIASAISLMIVSRHMPRKTAKGAEEAAKWLAFKKYLETIEEHNDLESVKDKFEMFLPYAMAFGLERRLIKKFSAVNTPAPTWWGPMYGPRPYYGYPHHHGYGQPGESGSAGPIGGPPGPLAGEGGAPSLSDMSDSMGSSLSSMSDSLGSMLSSASRTLTSQPPPPPSTSRSSGGWGGGGFSGGGFSGGGGGGGGSRGFG
jgi:uncharacterized membrane protein YgcG